MENEAKLKILQTTYAAVLAETAGHLGAAGLLEKVTEAKRRQAPATGARMVAQLGISDPAEVFTRTAEVFGCAAWTVTRENGATVAENRSCLLCALARRLGSPCPCRIYCLHPLEGMARALDPAARLTAHETLWEGSRCRVELTAGG
jgi:hypothetical protein